MTLSVRIHRPRLEEILTEPEREACALAAASLPSRIAERCSEGRIIWASAAPGRLGDGAPCAVMRLLFLLPTSTRLGLRGWRDTDEDVLLDGPAPVIWTAHEVEKGMRQLIAQSHFMLELLANPVLPEADGFHVQAQRWRRAWTKVLNGAITAQAPASYHDVASGFAAAGRRQEAIRAALTGLRLAKTGILAPHVPGQAVLGTMRHKQADGITTLEPVEGAGATKVDVGRLLTLLSQEIAGTKLPQQPPSYDEINELLVAMRLEELAPSC